MPLDPVIAAVVGAVTMPTFRSLPIGELRKIVDEASAMAPKLDVPIASIEDREIPGVGGNLPIRIYTPVAVGLHPLMVFCHGGGFVFGGLETSDAICRALCHGAQCVVLSVDYRLAPEQPFPAATDDAYAALLWAVAHASEIGVDRDRIAVGGESAGGNLATVSALRVRDTAGPNLCAQLLMYPGTAYPDPETMPSLRENADAPLLTTDDAYYCWDQYLPHADNRRHPYALPSLAHDLSQLPPAFLATGEYDPVRDDGEWYGARLRSAGNFAIVRRYAGMPHGFFSFVGYSDAVKAAMEEVCDWLRRRFA